MSVVLLSRVCSILVFCHTNYTVGSMESLLLPVTVAESARILGHLDTARLHQGGVTHGAYSPFTLRSGTSGIAPVQSGSAFTLRALSVHN